MNLDRLHRQFDRLAKRNFSDPRKTANFVRNLRELEDTLIGEDDLFGEDPVDQLEATFGMRVHILQRLNPKSDLYKQVYTETQRRLDRVAYLLDDEQLHSFYILDEQLKHIHKTRFDAVKTLQMVKKPSRQDFEGAFQALRTEEEGYTEDRAMQLQIQEGRMKILQMLKGKQLDLQGGVHLFNREAAALKVWLDDQKELWEQETHEGFGPFYQAIDALREKERHLYDGEGGRVQEDDDTPAHTIEMRLKGRSYVNINLTLPTDWDQVLQTFALATGIPPAAIESIRVDEEGQGSPFTVDKARQWTKADHDTWVRKVYNLPINAPTDELPPERPVWHEKKETSLRDGAKLTLRPIKIKLGGKNQKVRWNYKWTNKLDEDDTQWRNGVVTFFGGTMGAYQVRQAIERERHIPPTHRVILFRGDDILDTRPTSGDIVRREDKVHASWVPIDKTGVARDALIYQQTSQLTPVLRACTDCFLWGEATFDFQVTNGRPEEGQCTNDQFKLNGKFVQVGREVLSYNREGTVYKRFKVHKFKEWVSGLTLPARFGKTTWTAQVGQDPNRFPDKYTPTPPPFPGNRPCWAVAPYSVYKFKEGAPTGFLGKLPPFVQQRGWGTSILRDPNLAEEGEKEFPWNAALRLSGVWTSKSGIATMDKQTNQETTKRREKRERWLQEKVGEGGAFFWQFYFRTADRPMRKEEVRRMRGLKASEIDRVTERDKYTKRGDSVEYIYELDELGGKLVYSVTILAEAHMDLCGCLKFEEECRVSNIENSTDDGLVQTTLDRDEITLKLPLFRKSDQDRALMPRFEILRWDSLPGTQSVGPLENQEKIRLEELLHNLREMQKELSQMEQIFQRKVARGQIPPRAPENLQRMRAEVQEMTQKVETSSLRVERERKELLERLKELQEFHRGAIPREWRPYPNPQTSTWFDVAEKLVQALREEKEEKERHLLRVQQEAQSRQTALEAKRKAPGNLQKAEDALRMAIQTGDERVIDSAEDKVERLRKIAEAFKAPDNLQKGKDALQMARLAADPAAIRRAEEQVEHLRSIAEGFEEISFPAESGQMEEDLKQLQQNINNLSLLLDYHRGQQFAQVTFRVKNDEKVHLQGVGLSEMEEESHLWTLLRQEEAVVRMKIAAANTRYTLLRQKRRDFLALLEQILDDCPEKKGGKRSRTRGSGRGDVKRRKAPKKDTEKRTAPQGSTPRKRQRRLRQLLLSMSI